MLQFTVEKAKGSKNKRSVVLKTESIASKEGVEACARLVATLLGISETRQQDFLFLFVSRLENGLFLGSYSSFAKKEGFGAKTYSAVMNALKEKGLVEVHTGYTRVSNELPSLLSMFAEEGHSQVIIDFNIVPNQTSLDV